MAWGWLGLQVLLERDCPPVAECDSLTPPGEELLFPADLLACVWG